MEWSKHGIRVNSNSPGSVRTAMTYYVEHAPDWTSRCNTMAECRVWQILVNWAVPTSIC